MPVTVFQSFSYWLILLQFEPMACWLIEKKNNRKYHKLVHTFTIIPLSERLVKIGLSVDASYGKVIETPCSNRSLKLCIVFHKYYVKRSLKRSGTFHLKPHLKYYVSTYPPPPSGPLHSCYFQRATQVPTGSFLLLTNEVYICVVLHWWALKGTSFSEFQFLESNSQTSSISLPGFGQGLGMSGVSGLKTQYLGYQYY